MTTDPHLEADIAWLSSQHGSPYANHDAIDRLIARAGAGQVPIPMILHCLSCGMQHVDRADEEEADVITVNGVTAPWTNPPHRSHLCQGCGSIWRPADVATEGVAAIQTKGSADHIVARAGSGRGETALAWTYEAHEFGNIWSRQVMLNGPAGHEKNAPTKHHGSDIRNVVALFAQAPTSPVGGDGARLRKIASIIEAVDQRCMATDGPVSATLSEMTQAEISEIYLLASEALASPAPMPGGWVSLSDGRAEAASTTQI